MSNKQFTLESDGDGREQTGWPLLKDVFPNYEPFWSAYVVPATFRIRKRDFILLRPGAPKEVRHLATSNYGVFTHLVRAYEQLEEEMTLQSSASSYAFFGRLYSTQEAVDKVLSHSRKLVGQYGGAQINDRERRLGEGLDGRYSDALALIKKYRGPYVHESEMVRIQGMLPRPEVVDGYLDLSALAEVIGDSERIKNEFVEAKTLGREMLNDLAKCVNEIWGVLLREFAALKQRNEFLTDIATLSLKDETILQRTALPAQQGGWAPPGSDAFQIVASGIAHVSGDHLSGGTP